MTDIDRSLSSANSEGVNSLLHSDGRLLSASDVCQDTFEDAPDTTERPQSQLSQKSNSSLPRSLLEGGPSSATSTPRTSTIESKANGNTDQEPHISPSEETADGESNLPPPKSPLLTAHSASGSATENVNVGGDGAGNEETAVGVTPEKADISRDPPPKVRGLSGNLPSMPWGAKAAVKPPELKPSPASTSKRTGTGFSWFTRKPSTTIDANPPAPTPIKSPRLSERRNTMTSINSLSSNPELMLSKLDEANDSDSSNSAKQQRSSLRDRFKMLRMREEAGIQSLDGQEVTTPGGSGGALAGLIGRSASVGLGIGSPTSVADEKEGGLAAASPVSSPIAASPGAIPPAPDSKMAPGTAAGMAAGPSAMTDPSAPVDWDLWQAVVYEGPAAVARTSAEELGRAIATGIPSAIRGVVWQVLAQSKNEELEGVYRELVVRGTDKDRDLTAGLQGHVPSQSLANGNLMEKPSLKSSASSIHSDHSTPATLTNGVASPPPSSKDDTESAIKLQASVIAERKKKAQEDKLAVQKLEKVIRRDLGARTSYSKYAVAAGLQEGLFGVCKAYALFDEGVGYAQGMNFLVMPLLFNV